MRLALFGAVWFVVGCAGAESPTDDLNIDEPLVPQLGLWEVVEYEAASPCYDPASSRIHQVFVGRPQGLNHLSWGEQWDHVAVRCPVLPDGTFTCEEQGFVDRNEVRQIERTTTIQLSGQATLVGGDFTAKLVVRTVCEAWDDGECNVEDCSMTEIAELKWVSANGL